MSKEEVAKLQEFLVARARSNFMYEAEQAGIETYKFSVLLSRKLHTMSMYEAKNALVKKFREEIFKSGGEWWDT